MEQAYIWLICSVILIILEAVIPGGVIIFLGISGLVVFGLLKAGFVDSVYMRFIIWFIASIVMLLGLRSFFMKYFEGKTRVQNTDEDIDAYGQNATVIESINPSQNGRIYFRGTSWSAKSEVSIDKDETVIVIGRDSNTWVVKKINQ